MESCALSLNTILFENHSWRHQMFAVFFGFKHNLIELNTLKCLTHVNQLFCLSPAVPAETDSSLDQADGEAKKSGMPLLLTLS